MRKHDYFNIVNHIIMTLILSLTVLPFIYVIIQSFSAGASTTLLPKQLTTDAYYYVFNRTLLGKGLMNTIIILLVGVPLNLVLTTMTAYVLSKKFPGQKLLVLYILITMFFSGGLIPFYLTVANVLNLSNRLEAIIFSYGINSFYMIIMRNFFRSVPEEIEESARIDGAGEFTIFTRIVLPVSKPVLATFTLFYAVDRWNEWFNAMLFMRDERLYTLQLVLRDIIVTMTNTQSQVLGDLANRQIYNASVKAATIVIATVPVMVIYPFLQKYFTQGMLLGSVKQ